MSGKQEYPRKPPTSMTNVADNFITKCCIEYTSPWAGFEVITLVVIGTDCTGSCKSNYHTTTVVSKNNKNKNEINGTLLV